MTALTDAFPLGEFRILGPIGKGEFGKVHRATWTGGRVDVALKHVEADQGDAKLAAEKEGVRLQSLVWQLHPDIVPRVYRDGTSANGDYFIAMEFVRGESLHDILRRKRLDTSEAVRLATVLAGFLKRLQAFHPPILHSDLKPEHVLVLDDGSVRIIDFGIAKRPEMGAATHNAFLSVMYAAPERVEDEARNVHPSDDLWALGIMFFEMLAGRHPRDEYRARIEDAIRRDDLVTVATLLRERPGDLPSDCSPQLDAIVRKMLSPQPGHRYATAAQLLADFENYAQGRETRAWQQLVAAGRATRVVARPKPAAPGTPTLVVPPPLPTPAKVTPPTPAASPQVPDRSSRPITPPTTGLPKPATAASPVPPINPALAGFPSTAPPRSVPAPRGPVLKKARRRPISRRSFGVLMRAFVALMVVRALVGEAAVWNRTERFRDRIPSFQTSDLSSIPPMVRSLDDGALIGFGINRINRPLAARMLELAEPTIDDFRNDMPTARLPQWRSASAALAIARDVRPGDRRIRARARYVEGHLLRIDAQGRPPDAARLLLDRAIDAFEDAADLDDDWPDPYIALAAVHAYGLRDPDAVVKDVEEAASRGFSAGRREHAEVADAFSYRADQEREDAMNADGDERQMLLSAALADYEACVVNYAGVIGFFNSTRNLERCQRLHDVVALELEEARQPEPEPEAVPLSTGF